MKTIGQLDYANQIRDDDKVPVWRDNQLFYAYVPLNEYAQRINEITAAATNIIKVLEKKVSLDVDGKVAPNMLRDASSVVAGVVKLADVAAVNAGTSQDVVTAQALANSRVVSEVTQLKQAILELNKQLNNAVMISSNGKLDSSLLPIATPSNAGVVKPDGKTVMVGVDGALRAKMDVAFATASEIDAGSSSTQVISPYALRNSSYVQALQNVINSVTQLSNRMSDMENRINLVLGVQ